MAKKRPAQAVAPGIKSKQAEDTLQSQVVSEQVTTEPAAVEASEGPIQVVKSSDGAEAPAKSELRIIFPEWPTSKRGPQATPPPPGTRSINPLRPEQLAEVGYNQETGEPETESSAHTHLDQNQDTLNFDQSETAQDVVRKHKKERL
jgi:hypothetical protein